MQCSALDLEIFMTPPNHRSQSSSQKKGKDWKRQRRWRTAGTQCFPDVAGLSSRRIHNDCGCIMKDLHKIKAGKFSARMGGPRSPTPSWRAVSKWWRPEKESVSFLQRCRADLDRLLCSCDGAAPMHMCWLHWAESVGLKKKHMKWGEKSRADVGKELVRDVRVGFYQNILYVYMEFSNNKSNEKNVNKNLKHHTGSANYISQLQLCGYHFHEFVDASLYQLYQHFMLSFEMLNHFNHISVFL